MQTAKTKISSPKAEIESDYQWPEKSLTSEQLIFLVTEDGTY